MNVEPGKSTTNGSHSWTPHSSFSVPTSPLSRAISRATPSRAQFSSRSAERSVAPGFSRGWAWRERISSRVAASEIGSRGRRVRTLWRGASCVAAEAARDTRGRSFPQLKLGATDVLPLRGNRRVASGWVVARNGTRESAMWRRHSCLRVAEGDRCSSRRRCGALRRAQAGVPAPHRMARSLIAAPDVRRRSWCGRACGGLRSGRRTRRGRRRRGRAPRRTTSGTRGVRRPSVLR